MNGGGGVSIGTGRCEWEGVPLGTGRCEWGGAPKKR